MCGEQRPEMRFRGIDGEVDGEQFARCVVGGYLGRIRSKVEVVFCGLGERSGWRY